MWVTIVKLNGYERFGDNKKICCSVKLASSGHFQVVDNGTKTAAKCIKMKNSRAKGAKLLFFIDKSAILTFLSPSSPLNAKKKGYELKVLTNCRSNNRWKSSWQHLCSTLLAKKVFSQHFVRDFARLLRSENGSHAVLFGFTTVITKNRGRESDGPLKREQGRQEPQASQTIKNYYNNGEFNWKHNGKENATWCFAICLFRLKYRRSEISWHGTVRTV